MSQRHRFLLLPGTAILLGLSTAGLLGMVSGAPVTAAITAALVGLVLAFLWRWNTTLLLSVAVVFAVVMAVVEGIVSQHAPVFGTASLRASAAVVSGPGAALMVGMSLLVAVVAGWLLFIRRQPWGTAIIVASAFLIRSDVDPRFASWLPLTVIACLALVLLANALSPRDLGRGAAMLIVSGAAIALCWQLPAPSPVWSRGFIDPLASAVGGRYGPSLSEALDLTGQFRPSNRAVLSIHVGRRLAAPYWRLAVFDRYDGQTWTPSSGTSRNVAAGVSMIPAANLGPGHGINATVTVEQPDSLLVSPGIPLAFSVASRASYAAGAPQPSSATAIAPLSSGESYRVSGIAPPIGLAQGNGDAPESLAAYTQTPDEPRRVQVLAKRIAGRALGPIAQANALVHYLRDSGVFRYDIRAGSPAGQDAVDSFLFDTHRGYCNQFASALAILAREIGLPSRVVTGYVGGDYRRGSYLVRQRDAHSWVEIYIPAGGWLTFDPTPGFNGPAEPTRQMRSAGSVGRRAGLLPTVSLPHATVKHLQPQGHAYRVPIAPPHLPVQPQRGDLIPPWLVLIALGLLGLASVAVWMARRQPLNVYAALARGQSRAGLRIRAEETPLEFVERFQGRDGYRDARLIVDLYIRERYAGVEPSESERRAEHVAWRRLRASRLPAYSIVARR